MDRWAPTRLNRDSSSWSTPPRSRSPFAPRPFGSEKPVEKRSPFAPRPFSSPDFMSDKEQSQPSLPTQSFDLSKIPLHPPGRTGPIQPKSWLQQLNETPQQESDRSAEPETNHPESAPFASAPPSPPNSESSSPNVQPAFINRAFNFSTIPLHPPDGTVRIQPKVTIGQRNDVYEQEDDRVADRVMSMPDSAIQQSVQREAAPDEEEIQTKPLASTITPLVQREAMPEEEEEPLQAKASGQVNLQREAISEEEEDPIQTKGSSDSSLLTPHSSLDSSLETQLNSSQGSGSPLPDDVRAFIEPRFGADFSQVRVHTDSTAVQMNRDLNAQAFTHKQDVYFGAGKAPAKDALTAHELTHVVQQTKPIEPYRTQSHINQQIQQKCQACDQEESNVSRKIEPNLISSSISGKLVHKADGQLLLQRKEENNAALAEIQGLPMYELLPKLQTLPINTLKDEEAGSLVGGPRLIVAMQAVRAKIEGNIGNYLEYSKRDFQALPSDQATDILSYLGSGTSTLSTDKSKTESKEESAPNTPCEQVASPSHPSSVSQTLIDRLTGNFAGKDGDPGEGFKAKPYVAAEGQCTIGYGHVIYPKNKCKPNPDSPKECICQPPYDFFTRDKALETLKADIQAKIDWIDKNVHVDLTQDEFDALVDLALHVGSVPKDFLKYLHDNWCKDKDAVRDRYLKTAVTMRDPNTKKQITMKNFVERRQRRVWSNKVTPSS